MEKRAARTARFSPNNCGWQTPLADGTAIKMHPAARITASPAKTHSQREMEADGLGGDGTLTAAQIARVVADVRLSDIVYADGDERLEHVGCICQTEQSEKCRRRHRRRQPPPFLILRSKTSERGALQILQRATHVRN